MPRRGGVLPVSIDSKTQEIKDLKAKVTELEKKQTQLQTDLEASQNAYNQANRNFEDQKGLVTKNITVMAGLRADILKKDGELAAMNQTLITKKKEIDNDKLEIQRLEALNKSVSENVESLKKQVDVAKSSDKEVEDLMEKLARQELEIDTQKTQIVALQTGTGDEEKLKQIQDLKQQFDDRSKQEQDEIKSLKTNIEEYIKTIEDNTTKIAGLEDDLRKKDVTYLKKVTEDEGIIDTQNKTIDKMKLDHGKIVGDFNAQVSKDAATIAQQEISIKEHETTIKQHETTIKQHETTIAADKKTISDQQETIKAREETIATEKDEAKKQQESLQDVIETHKKKEISDKKIIDDLNSTIKTVNAQLATCQNQLKDYMDKYQKTHKELTTMTNAKTADAAYTALKGQFDDVTHEKGELEKKIIDLDMQIVDLKHQIDDLNKRPASNTSSKKSIKHKTPEEQKEELKKKHTTLLDELLKRLREEVDFPV